MSRACPDCPALLFDRIKGFSSGFRIFMNGTTNLQRACLALGISRATLYKLSLQGKVKLVKIAGRTVVPETEIDRLASGGAA